MGLVQRSVATVSPVFLLSVTKPRTRHLRATSVPKVTAHLLRGHVEFPPDFCYEFSRCADIRVDLTLCRTAQGRRGLTRDTPSKDHRRCDGT
jgi:hypothetical protein